MKVAVSVGGGFSGPICVSSFISRLFSLIPLICSCLDWIIIWCDI